MLKDVIDFVMARTGYDRVTALREINFAWPEVWNSDDLPNSVFEITVIPNTTTGLISLPYFVGQLRGVKVHDSKVRVELNTPRPYYHDSGYNRGYTWRVLGVNPLTQTITNASILTLKLSEPETEQFTATLIGPTDNAVEEKEQVIFQPGDIEHDVTKRFTDLTSAVKSAITKSNLQIIGANEEDFGFIPNDRYEARNTILQIHDPCNSCGNNCECYDILYKKIAPILVHDEQAVPFETVLATKTLEWILLPKDDGTEKALAFSGKSRSLLEAYNHNNMGVEKKLDLPRNRFCTPYPGYL